VGTLVKFFVVDLLTVVYDLYRGLFRFGFEQHSFLDHAIVFDQPHGGRDLVPGYCEHSGLKISHRRRNGLDRGNGCYCCERFTSIAFR